MVWGNKQSNENENEDPPYETDGDSASGDEVDEDEEEEERGWDEGGPSHCGYSEMVHNTLMSVGKSVHNVVGDPSESMEKRMKGIGNWFQEASYAVRDCTRGDADLADDASVAVRDVFLGGGENEQNNASTGARA
uniref:Uncharacterized protein n=1 Tax=Helicotheca tamesis TaxID=374047 RepID=A0A7S2MPR8_9STRA|mmetsp:Transcript_19549/g.26834  ORF Transcript_19549/g.26834 Transcript_19549/m.26834 type:complete len:135 (+) Transcript_19549:113-517(+)